MTSINTLPPKFSASAIVDSGVESGIEWMTYPAPLWGAVNGYVRIPDAHPWFGKDYEDIPVAVNGGLTFGSRNGWVGFDTLHSGDYWPDVPHGPQPWDTHWTADLVAEETKALARQVAEATS